MALANVAEWFYLQGLRVVIIDWDLEAPGLENFFYSEEKDLEIVRSQLGLIDLLVAYKRLFPRLPMPSNKSAVARRAEAIGQDDTGNALTLLRESLPPISDALYPIHPPKIQDSGKGAALWLLPAGWRSADRFPHYAQAVQSFDWTDFYASFDGELYFEWMRSQLIGNGLADLVLIDSRTGVTEMGGVCTRQLADVVVSVCAPNVQNLVGIATMAKSFSRKELVQKRGRGIEMVVVPARIDVSELDARNFFEHQFRWLLDEFLPEGFERVKGAFWDLAIQYIPKYAYSEKLAIGAPDSAKELEEAYKRIAAHLVVLAHGDSAIHIRKQFAGELQRVFGSRLPSLFISYPESDGDVVARQLRNRLEEYHLPLLPDFADSKDKRDRWGQITGFIDQAKIMLMIVTPDSLRTDSTRKQWRYARQQGVFVLLVKKPTTSWELDPADLPRWMRNAPFYDLDDNLDDLIRQLQNPPQTTRVPFMAPDPPDNFVERPVEFKQLKDSLLSAERENQGAINVALWGPPGSGKTALARAFCNDEDVITAYADGILWVTLGVNPNIPGEMAKLYASLTGERCTFLDEAEATTTLAEKLSDKNCLIVINDVWSSKHVLPFLSASRRCARLVTTGDLNIVTSICAKPVTVGEMSTAEAIQMIAGDLKLSSDDRRAFEEFVKHLGKSPLALRLAKAALRNRIELGDQPIKALHHLQHAFDKHGVIAFDQADADERDQSVARSIAFSLDQLGAEKRERYIQLAFFPGEADISLAVVSKLWGLKEFDAEEEVQRLGYLSLLKYDLETQSIRLNEVIRSYILNHMPDQAGLNTKLEAAFAHLSPEEQDGARRVCTRLVRLAQVEEVGQDTRLRIEIEDLGHAMRPLVDKLANAQIVAIGQDSLSGAQTVELVDDSVIQCWDRLRTWISSDREFLLWRQQLQGAIAYWEGKGRHKHTLLGGSALNLAKEWRKERSGDLNDAEIRYLDESQRFGRKRRNSRVAVATAVVVIVILVLGLARFQAVRRDQADAERDSTEHIKAGNDYMSKRKLDEAIAEFKQAAAIKSDNAEAHYNLGLAHFKKRQIDEAILAYDTAIGLRPGYAEAYLNRGRAYRHRGDEGDLDKALENYNRAISLFDGRKTSDPSELAKAYNFRGYAYYKKGDITQALEDCSKAIELDPKYADAYDSLGSVHLARGDKGDLATAVELFNEAIKKNPSYIVAYAHLGKAYFLNKENDRALAQLTDAIELFENLDQVTERRNNYLEALYYRGRAHINKGDHERAIEDLSNVIGFNEKYTEAYLYRGMEYKNRGDNDKAIADLNQVLKLSDNLTQKEWASQNLEHLSRQPITPRVFVRYADPGNAARIDNISRNVSQTMGYKVHAQVRPGATFQDVRFYYPEDKENAERIRQAFMLLLSDFHVNLKLRDRTNLAKSIPRGTIEVWLPVLLQEGQDASSWDRSQEKQRPAKTKASVRKL